MTFSPEHRFSLKILIAFKDKGKQAVSKSVYRGYERIIGEPQSRKGETRSSAVHGGYSHPRAPFQGAAERSEAGVVVKLQFYRSTLFPCPLAPWCEGGDQILLAVVVQDQDQVFDGDFAVLVHVGLFGGFLAVQTLGAGDIQLIDSAVFVDVVDAVVDQ